jgi:hypothetical protein
MLFNVGDRVEVKSFDGNIATIIENSGWQEYLVKFDSPNIFLHNANKYPENLYWFARIEELTFFENEIQGKYTQVIRKIKQLDNKFQAKKKAKENLMELNINNNLVTYTYEIANGTVGEAMSLAETYIAYSNAA